MINYSHDINGGLDECSADQPQSRPSNTRYKIEPVKLSSLEYYFDHNKLDFSKMEATTARINSNLYGIISKVFNYQKQMNSKISMIRLNSCILNMGLKVFDERINPKLFDNLLLKVDEYADGCVLSEFETDYSLKRMHRPGYTFDQVFTQNWNQAGGTIKTNLYKSGLLGTKHANIVTFGFTGRNAGMLVTEFLLLLGLQQSELLMNSSRVYNTIVKITDTTLKAFEQLGAEL